MAEIAKLCGRAIYFPPEGSREAKIFVPREEGNAATDICAQGKKVCWRRYPSEGKLRFWAQKVAVEKIFVPTEEGFALDGTHLRRKSDLGHRKKPPPFEGGSV